MHFIHPSEAQQSHPSSLPFSGPGCSETTEPIAGVSKHFNTIIVSYSAEAVTLADRDTYPLFFRTVPQMSQNGSVSFSSFGQGLCQLRKAFGPIHTRHGTKHARKLECFSFDVACVQCGHPHSHQQVPFACIALRVASCILCGLGLSVSGQKAERPRVMFVSLSFPHPPPK